MRIIFLGNVADYSPRYLEALVRLSQGSGGRLSIAAVVCPAARRRSIDRVIFDVKRRAGDLLDGLARLPLPAALRARLAGTGQGIYREMQRLASRCRAPVWWPSSPSDRDVCDRVARLQADLAIVAGLNRLVREPAFSAFPPLYNVHPSMLPEFRGAVPEFWQLDAGLTEGGVTIHRIDRGVDTGPIVAQRPFAIEPWFDAADLITRSIEVGTEMLAELLPDPPRWASGGTPQSGGSYQPIPGAEARVAPFQRPARGLFDRARAVGFSSPLVLHVDASEWRQGLDCVARDRGDGTLTLELFDPVVHPDATKGPPGLVTRTYSGGCVVRCASGAVEFRRAIPSSSSPSAG